MEMVPGPTGDPRQTASGVSGVLIGLCTILLSLCAVIRLSGGPEWGDAATRSPASWDRSAALCCVVLGLAVIGWWIFSFLAACLSEFLRRRGRTAGADRTARLSPVFMRRAAAALLGTQLLIVPAAHALAPVPPVAASSATFRIAVPELALQDPRSTVPTASWTERQLPTPRWNAERPAAPMERLMGSPADAPAPGRTVVVGAGDSLWRIAARMAGPGASDAQIAHAWPRWYHANRDAIGPDPNLLSIGTVLTRPPAELDHNGK
ncbi:MAG: hypothetical protein L0J58_10325 [Micrococcaceae bacterium]|nr:hypothetical protein [Micrococcaceae bacterium]MDN6332915.1 hypothetical protein [Micrococcaceae bacterium]